MDTRREQEPPSEWKDPDEGRYSHCLLAFLTPARIFNDSSARDWDVTIDQVNNGSYDAIRLHRVVTSVPFGNTSFSFVEFCVDGGMVIPALPEYRDKTVALSILNDFLCCLLFGGLYCEAVEPADLLFARRYNTFYVKHFGLGQSPRARLATSLREKSAGPLEAISLFEPEVVDPIELHRAYSKGVDSLGHLVGVSKDLLISACSAFVREKYGESLSITWTSTEQILDLLWKVHVLDSLEVPGIAKRNRADFLSDHRTWTASTRIEMLYRLSKIDAETYALLDRARRARNDFAHRGARPDIETARNALHAMLRLVSISKGSATSDFDVLGVLNSVVDRNPETSQAARKRPAQIKTEEIKFWREIVHVPGMTHYKGPEYPDVYDVARARFMKEKSEDYKS